MAAKSKNGSALQGALQRFVAERPEGWGHAEWAGLLDRLRAEGHDVSDEAAIGLAVERVRLAATLGQVKNVGPQRIRVIIDRYETIWSLRGAPAEELAAETKIPLAVAERIKQSV
jgi:excinuclease UvrABC nuclease subunit